MNTGRICLLFIQTSGWVLAGAQPFFPVKMLQAGRADAVPPDAPELRVDAAGTDSPFGAVGAVEAGSTNGSWRGSAVVIGRQWLLTAGHILDFNDDGVVDDALRLRFSLPMAGGGTLALDGLEFHLHPDFSGFANPGAQDDLGLVRLAEPLPEAVPSARWWTEPLAVGTELALAGFGDSGYGDGGYTVTGQAGVRRTGGNVVERLWMDDEGSGQAEVFLYDFDAPETVGLPRGSLGNAVETIIGSGDSGGGAFVEADGTWYLAGINSFTLGAGRGLFGEEGGGVLVAPYGDWIAEVTGIAEPAAVGPVLGALALLGAGLWRRRRLD